jgi:hypothetical protein
MTPEQEARVKIDQLLEQAGWRFFDADEGALPYQQLPTESLTFSLRQPVTVAPLGAPRMAPLS